MTAFVPPEYHDELQLDIASEFDPTKRAIMLDWEYPEIVLHACKNTARNEALKRYYDDKKS